MIITAVSPASCSAGSAADGIKPATGEFETLLAAGALTLADSGPGPLSLDEALGFEHSGTGWMLAALGIGAAGSALVMASAEPAPPASAEPAPQPAAQA